VHTGPPPNMHSKFPAPLTGEAAALIRAYASV
jgi:hypothetical protein